MIFTLLLIVAFNGLFAIYLVWLFLKRNRNHVADNVQYHPISIVIACYNEEQFVEQKLNELLDDEEWIEGSEIIIISNGSTDNTNGLLKKYESDKRVKIYFFSERIGKIRSINFALTKVENSLILFSDCRQRIKKHSVKKLVRHFTDPEISLVSSVILDSINKPSFIRKAINYISHLESKEGICCSVHGGMYVIRKECIPPLPTNIIFDDLYINTYVIANRGKVLCEPAAVIYDLSFEKYYNKERIERLTRGLLLLLFNHFRLIVKMKPLTLQIFVWHKFAKIINGILLTILIILMLTEKVIPSAVIFILPAFLVAYFVNIKVRVFFNFIIYQTYSFIKFIFNVNRSVDWDKLFIYKRNT